MIGSGDSANPMTCKPCHPQQVQDQLASNHARTLHLTNPTLEKALQPKLGSIIQGVMELERSKEGFAMRVSGDPGDPLPITHVFGSGKHGLTYVADFGGGEALELSRSYVPKMLQYFITPGHESQPVDNVGIVYKANQFRDCISCHTSPREIPIKGDKVAVQVTGITCSGCHGPTADHVKSAKAGNAGIDNLRKFHKLGIGQANAACSQCHRQRTAVAEENSEKEQTNRFQMVGMMKSACYIKTNGELGCTTCHNPHQNVKNETPALHDQPCMQCHTTKPSQSHVWKTLPCSIGKQSNCVTCHMRTFTAFSKGSFPTQLADHWIKRK